MMMRSEEEIRIRGVRAVDNGARLLVELETCVAGEITRETLSLFAARLTSVPQKGPIDAQTAEDLRCESTIAEAIGAGMHMLGAYGCSARHLIRKLCARGIESTAAEAAVRELCARGCLDEEANAVREAERDMKKLWGDRRILSDIAAKGYTRVAVEAARERLETANGRESSAARLAELLRRRRIRAPRDEKESARLYAALVRYGYGSAEIRSALRTLQTKNGFV